MTSEETNLELIKTLAHVQSVLRGLDNLKDVTMHESVKRILEDSKHVFKATEKHIVKDWEIINKQMHNIDSDMMETIIEAFQYAANTYWGEEGRFQFRANIDSYSTSTEYSSGDDRTTRTNFEITLNGYIIPDTVNRDISYPKKFLSKAQIVFNLETDDVDIPNFRGVSVDLNKAKEFMFDGSNTMIFEFTPYKDVAEIRADTRPSQKIGILVKNASGMHEKILIPIFIKSIWFDGDSGEEERIQGYKAPAQRSEKEKERAYPSRLTLEFVVPGKNSSVNFTRAGPIKGAKDVNLGTEYQFIDDDRKIVEFLVRSDGLSKKRDFVKILERIVMYYVRLSRTDVQAVSFEKKKEEDTTVGKNKPKPPNNKSLKDTFTELMKENYQPHCIARALQLLDSASVSGIKKFDSRMGTTRVCKDGLGGKSSIKLSDYTPTRSFGQLFGKINPLDYQSSINVLKAFAQKDSTGNPLSSDAIGNFPSERDELEAAIKRLTTAFNIVYSEQKDLASIEIKTSAKCDPKDIGKDIEIDRSSNKFREMRTASQKLLAYHLAQITRISEFLKKIFNITQRGDGSWKVEGPKTELLFAGFEVMNDLTNQARALLLDYYAGCEEIYQVGLKAWEADEAPAADKKGPIPGAVLPCLLYTSPSPRDRQKSRMPSSA